MPDVRRTALLLAFLLAGCAGTPAPAPTPGRGVLVTPLEKGRLFGGRAEYVVDAPLARVRAVLTDFAHQAEFRPSVIESESLAHAEDGGIVRFRISGLAGLNPDVVCRWREEREDGRVLIRYEMIRSTFALGAFRGSFLAASLGESGRTLIVQEVLVSALVMNREKFLADLAVDAEAIRRRIETGAAGER